MTQARPRLQLQGPGLFSAVPLHWAPAAGQGQRPWGAKSAWATTWGLALGIPGCPAHSERWPRACFWKPPSCFLCHAGNPGKCSLPTGKAVTHSQAFGGFHLEGRKILHTVSMATGLSEQSAWLCTLVGHVSQPCGGPERGLGLRLLASCSPTVVLIK